MSPSIPVLAKPGDEVCLVEPMLKACGHYEREGRKTCEECLNWKDPEMEAES